MKLKHIFSLVAGTALLVTACSPDDYSMGGAQYTSADLVQPSAYTVTVNGNKVDLQSKISGCTPLWVTPSGRSEKENLTLSLPFAGDYEVTFGADTRAGAVYGEPYKFTIAQNDFSLLSDSKWFYLADDDYKTGDAFPSASTLSEGIEKVWYPCDKDYGLGCTGPIMYMTPYDPTNTGNYTTEESANAVYKDITFGRANWSPNWDPGFQSWLIPEDDAYMASAMMFKMDAANGCTAIIDRGESGTKTASTHAIYNGKFNLNLDDKTHPTITFSGDAFALHNVGFDEVCSNYTQDVIIAELTPYYLCLVTKRTNSEGNWYIVWNFVSKEVKETNGACIPKEEANLLTKSEPTLPTFTDVATSMFTVENNGNTYVGNAVSYTVDSDAPYDWMWWNGASNANAWESLLTNIRGAVEYNSTWAPLPGDEATENELSLSKNSDGSYSYTYGDYEGKCTITNSDITFDKEVTFLTASNDFRTVSVTGTKFTILKMAAAEGMTIGVPDTKNENGVVDSYLCVNLKTKPLGGAQTGPTVVPLYDDYMADGCSGIEAKKYYRLVFYNTWNSGKGIAKDITKVKLKNGQKLTIKFTLKDPSAWSESPMCAICENCINSTWEPDCYNLSEAVKVNLSGETVVTLTNNTGSTQTFTAGSLQLSIQLDGYLKDFDGETIPDIIQSVSCSYE